MAKTGGSLFGRADATLVSAALKEGMSDMPLDMRSVYQQREKNLADFTKGITEAFDKIYADHKDTKELLTEVSQTARDNWEAGGNVNPYMLEQHNKIVNDFDTEFKSIPQGKKGDLERSKLRNKMNKYLSLSQGNSETLQKLIFLGADNSILTRQSGEEQKLLVAMINDYNNGTALTKPEYVDGDFVYTLPGTNVKMTMSELNRRIGEVNPQLKNDIQKIFNNQQKLGRTSKAGYNFETVRNNIADMLNSESDYLNAMNERFGGMNYTFQQLLHGQTPEGYKNELMEDLYDALEKAGGIDIDGDGPLKNDKATYANSENGAKLAEALQNDKSKLKEVLSSYLSEQVGRGFYDIGRKDFNKGGTGTSTPGGGSSTGFLTTKKGVNFLGLNRGFGYNVAKNTYDSLKIATEGGDTDFLLGATKYDYDKNTGVWTVTNKSGEVVGDYESTDNLIKNLGVDNDPDFKALLGSSEVTEESDEEFITTDLDDPRIKGDYSTNIKTIDIKTMDLDDNIVADNLAKWLPSVRNKSNPKGYAFYVTQAVGDEWSFEKGGGAMNKESVTLYQIANKGDKGSFKGPEGYWIKPAIINGKVVEIKTGGDLQRRRKAIADIDTLFSMPEFNNLMLDKPRI